METLRYNPYTLAHIQHNAMPFIDQHREIIFYLLESLQGLQNAASATVQPFSPVGSYLRTFEHMHLCFYEDEALTFKFKVHRSLTHLNHCQIQITHTADNMYQTYC